MGIGECAVATNSIASIALSLRLTYKHKYNVYNNISGYIEAHHIHTQHTQAAHTYKKKKYKPGLILLILTTYVLITVRAYICTNIIQFLFFTFSFYFFITPRFIKIKNKKKEYGKRTSAVCLHQNVKQKYKIDKEKCKKCFAKNETNTKRMYIKYDSGFIYLSNKYKQNRNENLHKMAMPYYTVYGCLKAMNLYIQCMCVMLGYTRIVSVRSQCGCVSLVHSVSDIYVFSVIGAVKDDDN